MRRLAVIGVVLGALIVGCGDSGAAAKQELHAAYQHGVDVGELRAGAESRPESTAEALRKKFGIE